jgi:hypothetical protein
VAIRQGTEQRRVHRPENSKTPQQKHREETRMTSKMAVHTDIIRERTAKFDPQELLTFRDYHTSLQRMEIKNTEIMMSYLTMRAA